MERAEMINSFYDGYYEDTRLERSRHGQMEYRSTMHFIRRCLPQPGAVLEIGAGTGRYSVALAKAGHRVTAVELAARNLELLRQKRAGTRQSDRPAGRRDRSQPLCRRQL